MSPLLGRHDVGLFWRLFVIGEAVMRANVANVLLLQLLGVNGAVLTEALTHKKIIAKGEEVCLDTHAHCRSSV